MILQSFVILELEILLDNREEKQPKSDADEGEIPRESSCGVGE